MYIWEDMIECIKLKNKFIGTIYSNTLLKYNIQIPNIQRIIDDNKVCEIVLYQKSKLKNDGFCNFLGTININFCEDSKKLYIIDGQHRYEAIKIINDSINIPVIIEVLKVKNLNELKENYNILNKNTPLPDFPETIDKSIPESVAIYFKNKCKDIFSISKDCKRPNLYFNYFQEALGYLTEKLNINSSIELQTIIEDYNNRLSNLEFDFSDAILKKCEKLNFYLGLFKYESDIYKYKWVKEILNEYGIDIIDDNKINCKKIKKNIPKKIKTDSWIKYIGNKSEVLCICCRNTKITPFNFEAGHIISEFNGGKINTDNIIPICSGCNKSMSTKNMNDFINEYFPNNINKFNQKIYDNI